MRRGVGVAGARKRGTQRDKYKAVGAELHAADMEHMSKQLAVFKEHLEVRVCVLPVCVLSTCVVLLVCTHPLHPLARCVF